MFAKGSKYDLNPCLRMQGTIDLVAAVAKITKTVLLDIYTYMRINIKKEAVGDTVWVVLLYFLIDHHPKCQEQDFLGIRIPCNHAPNIFVKLFAQTKASPSSRS